MFKRFIKNVAVSASTFATLATPMIAKGKINPGAGMYDNIAELEARITVVFNVVMGIVGLIVLIYIIMAGFGYLTSAGNSEKVTAAKNQIVYAIIGAIIIAAAFVLKEFIFLKVFNLSGTSIPR